MINTILLPDLREMLSENDAVGLHALTTELHAATIAEFTEGLSVEETWQVLAHAPLPRQAEIFSFFPLEKQVEMVDGVGRERMSALLEEMAADDRVGLLSQLDPKLVDALLPLVAKAERHDIRLLLSYPDHTAGSIMTTEYASLPADITAAEAISRLRQQAPNSETIYYVYVLDAARHLLGSVSLRELIVAPPEKKVADLMERDVISVRVTDDREQLAQRLARYDFLAIPVVDDENRLVGIVTHDDVIDVVVEEATEDVHRMGGVGPMAENYLEAPFRTIWWKRSIWLSCLFIAELFTFTALAGFEDKIAAVTVLALFVPLCISTGGNSGSQAATLITRAMALGQVRISDWARVLRHELLMGLALGGTLGAIGFLRAFLTPAATRGERVDQVNLAIIVSLAVAIICIWGTFVGSMLPLIFKRLGFDPAVASSPFVATFVDVTGILIYFTIAQSVLGL